MSLKRVLVMYDQRKMIKELEEQIVCIILQILEERNLKKLIRLAKKAIITFWSLFTPLMKSNNTFSEVYGQLV